MKNFNKNYILFYLLMSVFAKAQTDKKFYASFNSGYNLGSGKPNYYQAMILNMLDSNESSPTTSETKFVRVNLGKGLNVGANFGYMFTKSIGFELGVNYLLGSKISSKATSYTGDYTNSDVSAKMIQIKPTLVFRSGFEKINPYAKVGMIIGTGKITNNSTSKDGADITIGTIEFDGGMPIGFHASLGTLYSLNNNFALFAELNLISLEYAPKKGHITANSKNGIDQLPTTTIENKELEFVEEYKENSSVSDPNIPRKVPVVPFSFSSFGLNIGVQYQF